MRLNARDLFIADAAAPITDLGQPVAVTVTSDTPKEELTRLMQESGLNELPVVDAQGRLVGSIAYQALVGALREEATADIQKMVGVSKDERALSSPFFSVRKRLPWLQINLLTAFAAASVVGAFESTIAKYTALAVLLPVVAGQSGNAGAQALAVAIRGLALREIGPRQWLQLLTKEAVVGLVNGVAIAVTTGLAVLIWSQSLGLAAVISISMVISMVIAGASGALTPIILSKLGQDPAQSSSIVLTTITDIAGFMSFLGIATALAAYLPTG
jgi:magnesium transporter